MKDLSFITDRVLPSYAVFTGATVMADGTISDGLAIWAMRGFITLCIALITYFLKKMIDDSREANKKRDEKIDSLLKVTTAHEVMYEIWLEEMVSLGEPHPDHGTRKTDQLHRIIQRIAESKKENG